MGGRVPNGGFHRARRYPTRRAAALAPRIRSNTGAGMFGLDDFAMISSVPTGSSFSDNWELFEDGGVYVLIELASEQRVAGK